MGRSYQEKEPSRRNTHVSGSMLILGVLLLWSLSSVLPASAQAVYGSIFGTVTDNTGAVIPNANITVIDISKSTSVSVQTNGSGEYRVQHLIPDSYRVTAEAPGFAKATVESVVVYADTAPKVDVQLTVGKVSNNVVVTGTPLCWKPTAQTSARS